MRDSSVDVTDGSGFFIRIHHIYSKQIALETFFFFFPIISSIKSVKFAGRTRPWCLTYRCANETTDKSELVSVSLIRPEQAEKGECCRSVHVRLPSVSFTLAMFSCGPCCC